MGLTSEPFESVRRETRQPLLALGASKPGTVYLRLPGPVQMAGLMLGKQYAASFWCLKSGRDRSVGRCQSRAVRSVPAVPGAPGWLRPRQPHMIRVEAVSIFKVVQSLEEHVSSSRVPQLCIQNVVVSNDPNRRVSTHPLDLRRGSIPNDLGRLLGGTVLLPSMPHGG